MSDIIKIQEEINDQLANKKTFDALVKTTFKGLNEGLIKRAIMEGMMRGFKFNDFLEKNIYAIQFGDDYSLVNSIDYVRKIGMRSGVIGKSAPHFEEKDGKIISCTVTIKRVIPVLKETGEYTATVFFDEYNTKRNLWVSKPHTMIAKVAEMHALRMACPEEMSQMYIEDEMEKEIKGVKTENKITKKEAKARLKKAKNNDELLSAWSDLPPSSKKDKEVIKYKDKLKASHGESRLTEEEKKQIIKEEKNDN